MKFNLTLFSVLAFASGLLLLSGCGTGGDNAYINEGIARDYETFYSKGKSDQGGALAALNEAAKKDPNNGYTDYLKASLEADAGNFESAMASIKAGHEKLKVVIYVATPPPDDPMQTLNRIRQLGFSLDKALKDPSFPEYVELVREVGRRVAKGMPTTSLGVLNGSGVVRKSYDLEILHLKSKGDKAGAAKLQSELDKFEAWSKALTKELAETVKDLVQEAGKASGMTAEELADYSRGMSIDDKGKQEKADKVKNQLYDQEIAVLKANLAKMP